MASTHEELDARQGRPEREFPDLSTAVSVSLRARDPLANTAVNRISLVFGITLLWNARQSQVAIEADSPEQV